MILNSSTKLFVYKFLVMASLVFIKLARESIFSNFLVMVSLVFIKLAREFISINFSLEASLVSVDQS